MAKAEASKSDGLSRDYVEYLAEVFTHNGLQDQARRRGLITGGSKHTLAEAVAEHEMRKRAEKAKAAQRAAGDTDDEQQQPSPPPPPPAGQPLPPPPGPSPSQRQGGPPEDLGPVRDAPVHPPSLRGGKEKGVPPPLLLPLPLGTHRPPPLPHLRQIPWGTQTWRGRKPSPVPGRSRGGIVSSPTPLRKVPLRNSPSLSCRPRRRLTWPGGSGPTRRQRRGSSGPSRSSMGGCLSSARWTPRGAPGGPKRRSKSPIRQAPTRRAQRSSPRWSPWRPKTRRAERGGRSMGGGACREGGGACTPRLKTLCKSFLLHDFRREELVKQLLKLSCKQPCLFRKNSLLTQIDVIKYVNDLFTSGKKL